MTTVLAQLGNTTYVPHDMWQNTNRGFTPISRIKPIDLIRNELVEDIFVAAEKLNEEMRKFKRATFEKIASFIELSTSEYKVKVGGTKGNVTLITFNGRYKVIRSFAENITFDERIIAAKALIYQCIQRWTEHSDDNIKALIDGAFATDAKGNLSTTRIMGLRRLDIKDPEWLTAMDAIADSVYSTGSKSYIRIYERVGDTDQYKQLSLDLASI